SSPRVAAPVLSPLLPAAPHITALPRAMPSLYYVSVTAHLLAAFLWLGGMFFLAVVGAPVLRSVQPAALRADLFRQLGERFRTVGWAATATLVVTGAIHRHYRGLLSPPLW